MDNLIHVAVPCSDYARGQDRIVRYEKNDKTQTLTPIVDQYYNDPNNPNKQQILNRGIATQLSSQYQEFACGQWEYNDAKLEAKRPTMLKSYNKLNGEWVEVTPCNFEAGIKSGAVVSPYMMGVSSSKVLSDTTTSHYFNEKDEKKALNKTKEFEEEVKKRFINEPARMKLLIVVDKLLTGFDAPSLTYLYIDKKMQDHGLFQAVCRVNRLDGEDKDFGCIIDYSDLFDSLQEAHSDYTNGAFENYEREDIQGLISDKAQKIKKKLEEARDQLRSLCESVKEPKDETGYIAYFCGSDLEKNAQKRRLFYQLVGVFLRMFVELNHLEKPIYSQEEMQKIKQEAQFYRHLQKMIGLNSGDSVDLKSYSEDMRRILDAYIKTTDSKTLIKIEDQGLCEVLAQMDINDFNKELSEVFKNESSIAESIANNTRKCIIEKEASDPKYYEKLSSLLNDLINQFREKKLTYLEYLQQIHNLAKQVIHKEDKNYPKKINTNALKTLYDNLDQNEALALKIDACVRDNKKDGWVGHNQKEKNLKIALRKIINDESLLENTFNLAKHIDEYH